MTLLDAKKAKLIERVYVDGLDQIDAAEKVGMSRSAVSRTVQQFDRELACIIGDPAKWTPATRRDCVVRLLGYAEQQRAREAA